MLWSAHRPRLGRHKFNPRGLCHVESHLSQVSQQSCLATRACQDDRHDMAVSFRGSVVKSRPILFSAPMVRALLDGSKTQTRRIVKFPERMIDDGATPTIYHGFDGKTACFYVAGTGDENLACPYGQPGDRLWVRESFTYWERPDHKDSAPRSNESNRPADGKRYERWMNRVMAQELPGEDFLVYKTDDFKRSLGEWKHPHPIYEHCIGRFGKTVSPIHMPRWASRITLEIVSVRVDRLGDLTEIDAQAEGVQSVADFINLWKSINKSWEPETWIWVIQFRKV